MRIDTAVELIPDLQDSPAASLQYLPGEPAERCCGQIAGSGQHDCYPLRVSFEPLAATAPEIDILRARKPKDLRARRPWKFVTLPAPVDM